MLQHIDASPYLEIAEETMIIYGDRAADYVQRWRRLLLLLLR
jgi:hypothetical protein